MKAIDAHADLMTSHIIEQLNDLEYYETDGKTQKELISILAKLRALEIEVGNPGSGWF